MRRTTTRTMVQRLQAQAHKAELKALQAKNSVAVAQLRGNLSTGVANLREQMKAEERRIADAIPTKASMKRGPRKSKAAKGSRPRSYAPGDTVAALLAAAKRK